MRVGTQISGTPSATRSTSRWLSRVLLAMITSSGIVNAIQGITFNIDDPGKLSQRG